MRLLHVHKLTFERFPRKRPPYAILSHRWTDSEPSLSDIEHRRRDRPTAHNKVYRFADYISSHLQHLGWIWVDSCCIVQDSSAELTEGVNCMFEWYRDASVCIAYLSDVKHPSDRGALRRSVWFNRGWTLQELLASTVVIFVTDDWQVIGHKGNAEHLKENIDVGPNLESLISETTGIPRAVLQDFSKSHAISVSERMRWMDGRETLKEEDMYYAMFGIFGVTPGANYGEKKVGAEQRLLDAIEIKDRGRARRLSGGPSTKSRASKHNVPFPRDAAFVERREMSSIQEKLSKSRARVVLVGFGGIGKSQLAIELCYRVIDGLSNTCVLWLHASSATRFDQDISKLADDMDIPGRQAKDANIYQLVRTWLDDERRQWLVVLDNADDAEFLFEAPELGTNEGNRRSRLEYFPMCSHGVMLVTTRRKAIARRIVDEDDTITLEPDSEHATELLKSKLGLVDTTANLEKLAAALGHIPLAIAQAAAYINQRKPRYTIEDYLDRLEKSDRSKSSLLKVQSNELRRDRSEAENSILLTWQVSFSHISAIRRSAADLLSLMSFYDHQGIPDFLLKSDQIDNKQTEGSDSDFEDDADERFEEDVAMLRDYCFVSPTADRSVLQMHRLVQLATQLWLREKTQQYEQWQAQSLKRLNHAHPSVDYKEWNRCRILYPHARRLCNATVKDDVALSVLASILCKAARFADDHGLYKDAESMAIRCMNDFMRILGPEHPYTLGSMANLSSTYLCQGRWKEAEELNLEVTEAMRKMLGDEHPYTLTSIANLASTYWSQGRWKEAEELYKQVIKTRRRVLGEEHPSTLNSINNLAALYWAQGRWREAEELYLQVVETSRRVLGEKHLITLTSMGNLAMTYGAQGRWKEAEELCKQVTKTQRRVLGEEHPSTLKSINNLAALYFEQDRLQEACNLAKECLRLRIAVLSAAHPDTLMSSEWLKMIEERMQAVATTSHKRQRRASRLTTVDNERKSTASTIRSRRQSIRLISRHKRNVARGTRQVVARSSADTTSPMDSKGSVTRRTRSRSRKSR